MRIDTGQHLRIDQRMKLAPRIIQSMEILQMPSAALEARIEQELTNNPTLELREVAPDEQDVQAEVAQEARDDREGERELVVTDDAVDSNHADDFERLTNISEEYADSWSANNYGTSEGYRVARPTGERDGKLDAMANMPARPESLTEQLLDQWHLVETAPDVARAGEYLIDLIDNDGYLRTPLAELAEQAPADVDVAALDQALATIQAELEPVGIGAQDLRQCLLLQIDAVLRPADAHEPVPERRHGHQDPAALHHARLIAHDHLKDVEANRLPRIARNTGLSIEQVKQAIVDLGRFHPRPGRLLVDDPVRTISPDAVVEYDEDQDRYVATLCNGRLPGVQISSSYAEMGSDKAVDTKTREFINHNLRSARWLVDAIRQRHQTLLRVIGVVLAAQRDFFDQGPEALKPLPMALVADQLGIHVATVSRAVSEKYLQTSRGIVPLRMFFSGGTETEAGEAMSWAAVQAKLEQIIGEEDKAAPLSDDQLVDKLHATGIDIARRTVAKYRKQLGVPAARQRREY